MQYPVKDVLKRLHSLFIDKQLTLSVAESCTGGHISSLLTDMPGASEFFRAGMITYSSESKSSLLSVKWTTIIKDGAVSEETAREMAEGLRRVCKTDYSLSVTGNLGPAPMEGKDTGLVYFAVASPAGTLSEEMMFRGTRKKIKKQASAHALNFLYGIAG